MFLPLTEFLCEPKALDLLPILAEKGVLHPCDESIIKLEGFRETSETKCNPKDFAKTLIDKAGRVGNANLFTNYDLNPYTLSTEYNKWLYLSSIEENNVENYLALTPEELLSNNEKYERWIYNATFLKMFFRRHGITSTNYTVETLIEHYPET